MSNRKRFIFVLLVAILFVNVASGKDVFVPRQYQNIQAAINAVQNGDIIVVSPGVYQENVDFKGKLITLRSLDPKNDKIVSATIIDGGSKGSVVTFSRGETGDAMLSGFTIRNGSGTKIISMTDGGGLDEYRRTGVGGGLFIKNSSPTIELNVICNNTAEWYGGGICVLESSSPSITDNTIINNRSGKRGGGIWVNNHSSPIIRGNIVSHNISWEGCGIYVTGESSAKIIENNISDNTGFYGGGIYIRGGSKALIENNTVKSNKIYNVGAGIFLYVHATATIKDNLIIDNITDQGGAGIALCDSTSATISRNIISNNKCRKYRGVWGVAGYHWGGGAICIWRNSSSIIEENKIVGNSAKGDGGAICLHDSSESIIKNNLFNNNKTQSKGGAIYVFSDSKLLDKNGKDIPRVINSQHGENKYINNSPDNLYFEPEVSK